MSSAPGQRVQDVPPRRRCASRSRLFGDHDSMHIVERAGNRDLHPRETVRVYFEGGPGLPLPIQSVQTTVDRCAHLTGG